MRFLLKPLSYHISPADCKLQIKSNSITVTLKKEESVGHWIDLTKKSGLASATGNRKQPDLGSLGDTTGEAGSAQDSLMKMMKNLYETGDDEMKRTINESWAKA